jgi:Transposase, Mutator family
MARSKLRCRAIGGGSFEPQLIAKGQTRFHGFDDKILSLYARGVTMREIQGHLAELYATDVSPDLISRVTDEVRDWQNRPLDPVYPAVFFDPCGSKYATRARPGLEQGRLRPVHHPYGSSTRARHRRKRVLVRKMPQDIVPWVQRSRSQTVDATEMTAIHGVTMNGVAFDLSNDNEFGMLLEHLLKSSLQEHPQTLKYACQRTKAWLRAYALVSELERLGLLKGA